MRETHRNRVYVVGMSCMCMCRASRKCVERDSVSASSAHMRSAPMNARMILWYLNAFSILMGARYTLQHVGRKLERCGKLVERRVDDDVGLDRVESSTCRTRGRESGR